MRPFYPAALLMATAACCPAPAPAPDAEAEKAAIRQVVANWMTKTVELRDPIV